ncbi:MAG: DinB family protein [Vicinamibacterales bacterium]
MDRTLDSTVLHTVKTRLVKDYPAQINVCLEAMSDGELWWRPNEQSNSVANLVIHLAGSNRFYMEHVLGGRADDRDRAAEFAARGGRTKAELRRHWADSVASTERALDGFDPSRLMETTERTGNTTTFAQILLHVSHHNAVHLGQIVYIAKQLHPAAIDDIWMKMRGR